jgi:hypothetical protein
MTITGNLPTREDPGESFTPLETPAACSGDEDKILFAANKGFKAPCELFHWKVEDLLTGFTLFPAQPIGPPIYVPPKIEINDREGRGFLFKRNKWCIDTFPSLKRSNQNLTGPFRVVNDKMRRLSI